MKKKYYWYYLFFPLLILGCNHRPDNKFIGICRISDDTLKLEYAGSYDVIKEVDIKSYNDTLEIKVVSVGNPPKQPKDFYIPLKPSIRKIIIRDSTILDVDSIPKCSKKYSGEEALKYLRKLNQ
ncbi:hypothetical protein [Dysgonomonas macrotermitis]|uniref:Lipoprotein n=1 Tax=Dysgonomonas macrotermitis TaxID=1346286 RepID=A0A1M4YDT2_9BACT|nr:hypothetical protein [Dysgonomonas macrotermitis]SHF03632.1 hypothetical protein SAMN05444362_103137 [Dysgonomonas macrotermitis]